MTFTPIGQIEQMQAEINPLVDGGRRGAAGAATSPQSSSEIAAWLAKQRPADMDKAAVSRALSHNVDLTVQYKGHYPSGPNNEYLPSYHVAVSCDCQGTSQNRAAALVDLKKFETAAPIRAIEAWLAELSAISASRQRDSMESALILEAYASRLTAYPADIVREALLVKTWKWWPTWDELRTYCEAKAGPRRYMIAALQQPEPDCEPVRRPATQEERERVQALVDEMFPNETSEARTCAVTEALKGNCMKGRAA
jgi:hypothetical protein